MADEVTKPRPLGEEEVQDIQITLKSDANPMSVRELRVCQNILSSSPWQSVVTNFDSLANQIAWNHNT